MNKTEKQIKVVFTITEKGKRLLGEALLGTRATMNDLGDLEGGLEQLRQNLRLAQVDRKALNRKGISLDKLVEVIRVRTGGYEITKSNLSELERGNNSPMWDTMSILAAAEILRHPQTGDAYETEDYFAIACERINILTGDRIECSCQSRQASESV
jgi:transcriptional regulator with XRE-family HTH domain